MYEKINTQFSEAEAEKSAITAATSDGFILIF